MCFYQDFKLTNCGGWYYPISKKSCFLGLSEYTQTSDLTYNEIKRRMKIYMREFEPFNEYFKTYKMTEPIAKFGPITTLHSSIAEDNYLGVGDAAGAGTPFMGDGFREALDMAHSAYDTIIGAFKKNDFSKKTLRMHSRRFYKEYGKWYKWSFFIRFLYLRYLTNKEANLIVQQLKNLTEDEYYNLITSKITLRLVIRIFPFKVILLMLKNAFIYHILKPLKIMDIQRRPLMSKK
jgi:flavin-dependent dehydrogenase